MAAELQRLEADINSALPTGSADAVARIRGAVRSDFLRMESSHVAMHGDVARSTATLDGQLQPDEIAADLNETERVAASEQ